MGPTVIQSTMISSVRNNFLILVAILFAIPILLSVTSGLFGGVEGFECWCRSDSFSNTVAVQSAGSPVSVLGAFGINPWGSSVSFKYPTAQWIWNIPSAASSAPDNTALLLNSQKPILMLQELMKKNASHFSTLASVEPYGLMASPSVCIDVLLIRAKP